MLETPCCRRQRSLPNNLTCAWVWDIAEMTEGCLASGYYPIVLFHMGTHVTTRDFKHIRRDYMDFEVLAKGVGP